MARALFILALVLGIGVLVWAGMSPAKQVMNLDRSALGLQGLIDIAPEYGLSVRTPSSIAPPRAAELSLRVLGLYDMDLTRPAGRPRNRAEVLGQTTLRDIAIYDYRQKVVELPTLVVLPKWRQGVIETGVATPAFLIPQDAFDDLFAPLDLAGTKILRATRFFLEPKITAGNTKAQIALFNPQLFDPDTLPSECKTVLGIPTGSLLITCGDVSFLSDPDLLNTHGITNGSNASIAIAILNQLKKRGQNLAIYIDPSSDLSLAPEETPEEPQRAPDSLAAFFRWPLSLLWLAGALVFSVAVWRGLIRFGPARQKSNDRVEISKRAAIAAKARVIRLSENDPQMVGDFVETQLQELAAKLFGADVGVSGIDRLLVRLERKNPAMAAELAALRARLVPGYGAVFGREARKDLDQFKSLMERLTDGAF